MIKIYNLKKRKSHKLQDPRDFPWIERAKERMHVFSPFTFHFFTMTIELHNSGNATIIFIVHKKEKKKENVYSFFNEIYI